MSKNLKHIGTVSLWTVVSRLMGLVREMLSAAIFGASIFNSAFVTAYRLPNLFRRLLGEGSLTAAFVPTLQAELHENGKPGAYLLLNKVASWLALVTGSLVVLGMLALSHSRLIAGRDDKWYLAADLTVILCPYLAFICVAAAFNATLNVFGRFTEPALSPLWLNLCMIATLAGAGLHLAGPSKLSEIHWLCAGVLAGGFLQMAVPAGVLMHEGWRPRLDLAVNARVREIGRLMLPGLFGTAIYQVNLFVSGILAYSLNDFASTLIYYSNRLMELPIGVFAIATSTVVYPLLARHAVQKNMAAMGDDFRKGLRLILIINLPAAVGMAILCQPIVRLLFQHGHFTAGDARLMAPLLALYVVGMPFFSVVNLTVRAFYSIKDTATPVKIAAIDFVVNLVLSLVLMRRLGTLGLVLASTVAIIVQTTLLHRALARRLPHMSFRPLWKSVGKALLGAAAMAAVLALAQWRLDALGMGRRQADAVEVFGFIPLGVAVYAAVLWALRIEGREDLAAIWAKLRRKAA